MIISLSSSSIDSGRTRLVLIWAHKFLSYNLISMAELLNAAITNLRHSKTSLICPTKATRICESHFQILDCLSSWRRKLLSLRCPRRWFGELLSSLYTADSDSVKIDKTFLYICVYLLSQFMRPPNSHTVIPSGLQKQISPWKNPINVTPTPTLHWFAQ